MLPFINTPLLLLLPIPIKNAKGTDITSAHGHETTKKVSALKILSFNVILKHKGNIIAINTASNITIGV